MSTVRGSPDTPPLHHGPEASEGSKTLRCGAHLICALSPVSPASSPSVQSLQGYDAVHPVWVSGCSGGRVDPGLTASPSFSTQSGFPTPRWAGLASLSSPLPKLHLLKPNDRLRPPLTPTTPSSWGLSSCGLQTTPSSPPSSLSIVSCPSAIASPPLRPLTMACLGLRLDSLLL